MATSTRSTPINSGYTIINGSSIGKNDDRFDVWAEYKVTAQSIANNTSTVNAYFYAALKSGESSDTRLNHGLNSEFSVGGKSGTIVTDGAYDFRSPSDINVLGSFSGSIAHNANGTKSITISGKFETESEWISGGTLSKMIALPAIARKSDVSTNVSSVVMGDTLKINIKRSSEALTHTLTYAFGEKTGTIATGVGTSNEWTVPDLAKYCNNALSGDLKITCKTYSGSTLVGSTNTTITLNVPDPTIPEVDATSVYMGTGSVKVTTPRKSSNFKHHVSYSFGSASGVIAESMNSYWTWEPGYDLASEIQDKTSGTCTITCVTLNGTAKVGTKTVELTLKVPDNEKTKPKITIGSFVPDPNDVVASGFDGHLSLAGLYIRAKSKLKVTFNAESAYSKIDSYSLKVGGDTKRADEAEPAAKVEEKTITSDYIMNSGDLTVTLRVTDARGYYAEAEGSITVLDWFKPYIDPVGSNKRVVCERQTVPTAEGVTVDYDYLYIAAKRVYALMEGENKKVESDYTQGNLCTMRYRYKEVGGSYGEWANLVYSGDLETDEYDDLAKDESGNSITLKKALSYEVQIQVLDATNTVRSLYFTIPTEYVTFHLGKGGKKASFGKYAGEENALEIAEDWKLHAMGDAEIDGNLNLRGTTVSAFVVETGTHDSGLGTLRYRIWNDGTFDFWGNLKGKPTSITQSEYISGLVYSNQFLFTLPFSFNACSFTGSGAASYIWVVNCAIIDSANKTLAYRLLRSGSLSTDQEYSVHITGHGTLA